MNFGELKTRVVSLSHRSDLSDQTLRDFINTATVRINRRLGKNYPDMGINTDTNEVLAKWSDLYIYGTMAELSHFIRDWEDHDRYNLKFEDQIDRQNITTDPLVWISETPYIRTPGEQIVEDQS